MSDEKKILEMLRTATSTVILLLGMNTIALVISIFFSGFKETTLYIWAFVTVMGWVNTFISFKKVGLSITFKK